MSDQNAKIAAVIDGFTDLMKAEKNAINERDFKEVSELSVRKTTLLGQFDQLVASLEAAHPPQILIDALNRLRIQAEENAASLKAMAEGVSRARARLKAVSDKDFSPGVYRADGEEVKNPDAATFTSKA